MSLASFRSARNVTNVTGFSILYMIQKINNYFPIPFGLFIFLSLRVFKKHVTFVTFLPNGFCSALRAVFSCHKNVTSPGMVVTFVTFCGSGSALPRLPALSRCIPPPGVAACLCLRACRLRGGRLCLSVPFRDQRSLYLVPPLLFSRCHFLCASFLYSFR